VKFSWVSIDDESRSEWEKLCPIGEYRVIQAEDVPPIVPAPLVEKGHSFLVMASGSPTGTAIYMVNTNRLDTKDRAIDQEPFGLAFVGNNPVYSGCFIHHGTWEGRTRSVPKGFIDGISSSTLDESYCVTSIPNEPAGKIEDLSVDSQQKAFQHLLDKLTPYTYEDRDDK
jgi:hypothetical protein